MPFDLTQFASVDELFTGKTGAMSPTLRTYTRRFRVVTLDVRAGPVAVCNAPGIPDYFSPYEAPDQYEVDSLSLLVNKEASQPVDGEYSEWIVTCTYSTDLSAFAAPGGPSDAGKPGGGGGGSGDNPELEPPEVSYDYEESNYALFTDLDKKKFTNSSGQPFKPTPKYSIGRPVILVKKSVMQFNFKEMAAYAYTLNNAPIFGYPPGRVMCMPIKATRSYRGPLVYFRAELRFRCAANIPTPGYSDAVYGYEDFQPRILDEGSKELVEDPNLPLGSGVMVQQDIVRNLNRDSFFLNGKGQPYENQTGDDIYYLSFRIYKQVDFQPLVDKYLAGLYI